ncbi:hypothetical protein SLA_6770 [Streptomyces laurentii]|uniref:Uncharacterized protein n=1 Tax=Streptomyces laurentii TaxID=39478 RepID=A0A160P8H2_STRLU|nr:hypothetical protein SLA_6770 [Streptomyces laurentii]
MDAAWVPVPPKVRAVAAARPVAAMSSLDMGISSGSECGDARGGARYEVRVHGARTCAKRRAAYAVLRATCAVTRGVGGGAREVT